MSFMFYKNFYITVTLNKSLSFEVNEEDINRDIKEGIYTDALISKNGIVTYKMSIKQYISIISEMRIIYEDSIKEMIDEEDNIIEIRRNRNFNKFMVIVSSDKVPKSEQLITSNLLYMGKRYNIYKKTNLKNIKITYYDNINKKVIKENLISIND